MPIRILAALALSAALTACTYRIDESNIVIPRVAGTADLRALRARTPAMQVDEHRIVAADGTALYSVAFRRPDAVATVLYFGGNGYTVAQWAQPTAALYADQPVDVVVVDYRGYGASGGTASLAALYADALPVYDALRAGVDGTRPLIVHGHSLGSFVAGHLATQRRLDGLVLEATVGRSEDWAAHLRSRQSRWARLLVRRVVPTGTLAGQGNAVVAPVLDEPVLYVVGANDVVTPASFSQALFDATPLPAGRKRLLVVPGASHMAAARSPEYAAAFSEMLQAVVGSTQGRASARADVTRPGRPGPGTADPRTDRPLPARPDRP